MKQRLSTDVDYDKYDFEAAYARLQKCRQDLLTGVTDVVKSADPRVLRMLNSNMAFRQMTIREAFETLVGKAVRGSQENWTNVNFVVEVIKTVDPDIFRHIKEGVTAAIDKVRAKTKV